LQITGWNFEPSTATLLKAGAVSGSGQGK